MRNADIRDEDKKSGYFRLVNHQCKYTLTNKQVEKAKSGNLVIDGKKFQYMLGQKTAIFN